MKRWMVGAAAFISCVWWIDRGVAADPKNPHVVDRTNRHGEEVPENANAAGSALATSPYESHLTPLIERRAQLARSHGNDHPAVQAVDEQIRTFREMTLRGAKKTKFDEEQAEKKPPVLTAQDRMNLKEVARQNERAFEAAKATYDRCRQVYERGELSVDHLHAWSERLMAAEARRPGGALAAATGHLERMSMLLGVEEQKLANGAGSAVDVNSAWFFVEDARYHWLRAEAAMKEVSRAGEVPAAGR